MISPNVEKLLESLDPRNEELHNAVARIYINESKYRVLRRYVESDAFADTLASSDDLVEFAKIVSTMDLASIKEFAAGTESYHQKSTSALRQVVRLLDIPNFSRMQRSQLLKIIAKAKEEGLLA
jgi:hypothetical protein